VSERFVEEEEPPKFLEEVAVSGFTQIAL